MLFHRHKFSEIKEDGYQYCLKCGIAIVPPCIHNWEKTKEIEVKDERWGYFETEKIPSFIYVYECKKCKAVRQENINI